MRSTFDASLVEGIPDLPIDSTHWVSLELGALQGPVCSLKMAVGSEEHFLRLQTRYVHPSPSRSSVATAHCEQQGKISSPSLGTTMQVRSLNISQRQ